MKNMFLAIFICISLTSFSSFAMEEREDVEIVEAEELRDIEDFSLARWKYLPAEIKFQILIPSEIKSSEELIDMLKITADAALISKKDFAFVDSPEFEQAAKKVFNTIPHAKTFMDAGDKLFAKTKKQNDLVVNSDTSKCIKVLEMFRTMYNHLSCIKHPEKKIEGWISIDDVCMSLQRGKRVVDTGDQFEAAEKMVANNIRGWIEQGFNPFIIFEEQETNMSPTCEVTEVICDKNLLSYFDLNQFPDLAIQLLKSDIEPIDVRADYFPLMSPRNDEEFIKLKKIFRLLIERGINPNKQFRAGSLGRYTLLALAVIKFQDDLELIELLLQKGADPREEYFTRNAGCATSYLQAEELEKKGKPEIMALFRKYEKINLTVQENL